MSKRRRGAPTNATADKENIRIRLMRDFKGLCGICQEPIDPAGMGDEGLTIDHILARFAGGPDAYWNMQPAHWRCNNAKSHGEVRHRSAAERQQQQLERTFGEPV